MYKRQSYDVSGSSVTLVGTPAGHISYQFPTIHFVYAEATNGTLEEFTSVEGVNQWVTLSLGSGGMNGTPMAYTYSPTNTTHIVFYPGTDGHLHEAYYSYPANWQYQDLGAPASGTTIAGGANGYGF